MPREDGRRSARLTCGLIALAGGLLMVGSTFLGWITTAMQGGGRTAISGWGSISGGDELVDGVNINTLMAGTGEGSYRPAVPMLVVGLAVIIPALILTVTGAGSRPHRIVGWLLAAGGAVGAGWGMAKWIAPGDALGVLPGDEGAAGWGPVVGTIGGLAVLVAAVLLLIGALDPPEPVARRGIQPSR